MYLLKFRGELSNLVLQVSEAPNPYEIIYEGIYS